MQRLSTNSTIFLKFFIPIFWLVFFGLFLLAIFTFGRDLSGYFRDTTFRIGAVLFYLSGIALFYFTLFPLKRIEADEHFVYATNYFKTIRYPWHNVESMTDSRFLVFTIVSIELKQSGQFGKNIRFFASNKLYRDFRNDHPDLI